MAGLTFTNDDKKGAQSIELRSEQIQEILGQVPRWVVRYGTWFIFLVLLLLFIGSSLLKYPDVITARIKLTTETPPADIVAKTSARIEHLEVKDKETVYESQVLAVLESAAEYGDILKLTRLLGNDFNPDSLIRLSYPQNMQLGPVQVSYAAFQKRLQEYESFIKLDYHQRKIASIRQELVTYSTYLDRLKEQEEVLRRDYQLAEKQYQRDSLLFVDRVISSTQLEKAETQKLTKLYDWKDTQTKLASAQIDVANLRQEILELELKSEENSRQHTQQLREDWELLKGQLDVWKEKFAIVAPFDGQVSFTRIWSENQYVESGQVVLTVLPLLQGDVLAKALLDVSGAGKVEEGHHVVIRFDNYPYMEFGTVSGEVSSISLVPNNDQYAVEIRLDSSRLVTNYNSVLNFQQNMPGTAEIITDQRTLLQRITDPFRSAFRRQQMLGK